MAWALDETGTANTSLLCKKYEHGEQLALVEQQEECRVTGIGVPEEILQVHGVALASKPEGVV